MAGIKMICFVGFGFDFVFLFLKKFDAENGQMNFARKVFKSLGFSLHNCTRNKE